MPTPDFFATHSLYSPIAIADFELWMGHSEGIDGHSFEAYCDGCRQARTWHMIGKNGTELTWERGFYRSFWLYNYECAGCRSKGYVYLRLQCTKKDDEYSDWTVTKIGQWPPMSVAIEPAIKRYLGDYTDAYRKGLICQAQGFGVGAFAYYRFIVESLIDGVLERILAMVDESTAAPVRKELQKLKDDINVSRKIEKVKDVLPPALRIEGMNPLDAIYQLLSASLHQADEATCLEMGDTLRRCLVTLCQHISQVGEDSSFKDDVAKVIQKLAKRTRPNST